MVQNKWTLEEQGRNRTSSAEGTARNTTLSRESTIIHSNSGYAVPSSRYYLHQLTTEQATCRCTLDGTLHKSVLNIILHALAAY